MRNNQNINNSPIIILFVALLSRRDLRPASVANLDSLLLLYLLWNLSMNLFAFLNRFLSTIGCSFPLALLFGDPITFLLGNFGTTLLVFTFLIRFLFRLFH